MAAPMHVLKRELRKNIRSVLSELSESAVASQTSKAVRTLLSTPEYQAAKSISVYLSMPFGEISTAGIVHDALKQGKRVFVPYTYKLSAPQDGQPKSIMDMLELHGLEDYESLKPDSWGIPTPSGDSLSSRANTFGGMGVTDGNNGAEEHAESILDLIVMPGMAFDSSLGRLGHGKGFYDYFLHRCQQTSRMPFRVGLSLTEQFLPPDQSVPMDATDFRLDALVLGNGELRRA